MEMKRGTQGRLLSLGKSVNQPSFVTLLLDS